MSIGVSLGTAALIGGGLSAAGGLASSLLGSSAATTAAGDQEQASQAAIAEQEREFNQQQTNYAPFLAAATGPGGALGQLTAGTQPGGSLVTPYGGTYQTPAPFTQAAFTAPTGVDESNDPGYAFRLQQGDQAVQRAAAASGGAFSGGTLKALSRYGQDYASNEYSNVYNRALNSYQTNANTALNAYNTNATTGLNAYNTQFNAYNTNQGNTYNRLAALSGLGQTATGQLGQLGQASTANLTNLITGQGNAQAAGALGSASAINSGLGSLTGGVGSALNAYQSGQILQLLMGGGAPSQSSYAGQAPLPYVGN